MTETNGRQLLEMRSQMYENEHKPKNTNYSLGLRNKRVGM